MKVILLENVKSVGKEDDIVEVNDGYARNYLIRRNLALEATPKNLHDVKQRKQTQAAKAKRELEEAQKLASELNGQTFTLQMKAGEAGKLYGAVTAMDVAAVLKTQGFTVDKRDITLKTAIKNIGSFTADLKLHNEVTVPITVKVEEKV